jgi:Tfp pilus assembly protein PilV
VTPSSWRDDRASEAGFSLIEAVIAMLILATAVVALMGGLGTSIVASDAHRKTVTTDAAVRSWAESIQAATWVSCAQVGTPYGPPQVLSNKFTAIVTLVQYGTPTGVGFGSQCTPGAVTDTVQAMTLVVRATDGRGVSKLQIVKRKP